MQHWWSCYYSRGGLLQCFTDRTEGPAGRRAERRLQLYIKGYMTLVSERNIANIALTNQ